MADPRPRVSINREAPLSETSVVIASYPVAVEKGGGFVFVSLPHEQLGQTLADPGIARSVELLTFTRPATSSPRRRGSRARRTACRRASP